jgi:periplasmic copper chaperone A
VRRVYGGLLMALLVAARMAAAADSSGLMVLGARAMATLPGAPNSVVYLTLHNAGGGADRLLGASTPLARRVEIHGADMSQGVNRMRPLDGVAVAVGSLVEFKSGGAHLMLLGLSKPLQAGMVIPLTLRFQRAGSIALQVPVVDFLPQPRRVPRSGP